MKHILLTGRPRTGKTTLLKRIIRNLKSSLGGFYTEEITRDNKRAGFKIKTLDGREGILAMEGLKSGFRLGRYGINIEDLEMIGVKAVEEAIEAKDVVVIDEIGKMELFSQKFRDIVLKALDSGKVVMGVIHREDAKFLKDIKSREDVAIFEVNLGNHDEILKNVNFMFESSTPAQRAEKHS